MASSSEHGVGGGCDRMAEALRVRVGDNDYDAHARGTLVARSTIIVMESQGHRVVPVWCYMVGFLALGASLTFAGTALSHLRDRVGTDNGGIALIFVGQSIGYMLGSFLGGRGLDRGHGHRIWAGCMLLSLFAIAIISQVRDLVPMVGVFSLLGVFCGHRR